jgi:hypothetical protein
MPPASQSSEQIGGARRAAAAASDDIDSVRERAGNMVKMADMTIRSTEKVERKAAEGIFDESAVDFLLDGSDASNLDTADEDEGLDGTAPSSTPSALTSSEKATGRRSSKKKERTAAASSNLSSPTSPTTSTVGGDGDEATTATDSMLSLGGLSTANATINDNASAETLREQLNQTRRALLQVRENAKLKHRKLELEHTTVKKELKKAKGRSCCSLLSRLFGMSLCNACHMKVIASFNLFWIDLFFKIILQYCNRRN